MLVADFKKLYPKFAETSDEQISAFLLEAEALFSKNIGAKYETILALHVAHELALHSLDNPFLGDVVSRSIEGGSITYATIAHDSQTLYYSSTNYGKKLLALMTNIKIFAGSVAT